MPENVVNPGSPTSPTTPIPAGSPASPASGAAPVIPAVTPEPARPGTGKPPEGFVSQEALHEERTKRQGVDAKLAQMKALFGDRFVEDEYGNIIPKTEPAPADGGDIRAQLDKLWDEDPKRAVQTEIGLAFQWYDSVNSQLNIQKNQARSTKTDFATLEPEIDKYISRLPVDQRSKPGVVELAYLVVKGQNADTYKQRAIDELIARIKSGESVQGITGGTFTLPATPASDKPTADEIAVANAMGMSVEDYMKNRKK